MTDTNQRAITDDLIARLRADFTAHPTAGLMQNAVSQVTVTEVALRRDIVTSTPHTFSNRLDDWKVTNQKKSGRCWMFAGLNLLRTGTRKLLNIEEFEYSQNYTLFWDKFERSNYFLTAIIQTADRDVDDRTVAYLLDHPLDDGGQWNMFVNLVNRYGLVPKEFMPETESSSATMRMNANLLHFLRQGARRLRDLAAGSAGDSELDALRLELLATVYRMLAIHLGTPPASFDWQWTDKDKKFHRDGEMTPQEFAAKYAKLPLGDFACLVHDPRPANPAGKTYTVDFLGNVVGGGIVKYLNIGTELMKEVAMRSILDGEPVWMGCDVGKMMNSKLGLWDAGLFDYDGVYGTTFDLDKAGRLDYHQTLMTHAMLFTGVDVVDGKPRRWRVENSWGDENGQQGYYVMNDNWFDEYMFEIAARKSYLPEDLQKALELEPKVLPAWDPMGALAR